MTKLKTLNELTEKVWDTEVTPEEYFVTVDNLRKEAIKWVQEMKKIGSSYGLEPFREKLEREAQMEWITKFFNLTEEEVV